MSQAEYDAMERTGKVQEGAGGATSVAYPADPHSYRRQATTGTLYVEFDVPAAAVAPTSGGWAKIPGPNSIDARLATRQGRPAPELPSATGIQIVARK